ncbi:MAG: hypothetical protein EPO42_04570 [Gallionellaceae bacterium]|nr:MAG: hypothetical protein EPO42_04570 [Gallionellaceae bacterium]
MNRKELRYLSTLTHQVSRYEAYCTSLATHGGVIPPRNGTTIPRRTRKGQAVAVKPLKRQQPRSRALPYTAMNTHYASFNYGF